MRINRFLTIASIIFFSFLGNATHAQDVTLERVWPSYRDAASFTRLLEYFGGNRDETNRNALRTQPEKRAGYYWLVRTASADDVAGCTIKLEIHRAGQTDPTSQTFPVSLSSGSHVVNVGLTGTDWADPTERPIAWRLTLLDVNGTPLATEHSFLWQRQTKS